MNYHPMDYKSSRQRRVKGKGAKTRIIKFLIFGLIACVLAVPILFLWLSRDLPEPGKLITAKYKDATRIYDRHGELLYSVYQDENRTYVKLSTIPKTLQHATIAIEDKDF